MTDRLGEIQTRIHSVQQLGNVVAVMRSIAASRAQQSRSLLPAIDAYSHMIGEAVAQALALVPGYAVASGDARWDGTRHATGDSAGDVTARQRASGQALVVFGAEQGFAGAYGDTVFAAVTAAPENVALFLVGTRTSRRARERGLKLAWEAPMAAHPGAIAGLAANLAEALYAVVREGGITRIDVVFPIWRPGAELVLERRSLLPLDQTRCVVRAGRQAPLITLPPALLLEHLAEEYVTAQLCEAATHAFAAENEARAAAMLRAKTNIGGMMEALEAEERRVRQEAITAEVVELACGSLMR